MDRRQFIKRSALAAGAAGLPTIIPSSALGLDHRPPPSDRITMASIGVGQRGTGNTGQFLEIEDVQIVAVCDVNREGTQYVRGGVRGREPAQRRVNDYYAKQSPSGEYDGCDAYTDFRDLLSRPDIDAVCISTPDHWHAYIAIAAARAGKDIYCEKPLTRTVYEGRRMASDVRRYERVFQTGSQQRSDQNFRHACELARNGYLGEIQKVYARVGGISQPCRLPEQIKPEGFDLEMWLGNAPPAFYNEGRISGDYSGDAHWRMWRQYCAGPIADWGAHNFDIAQWGLGMDDSGPVEIIPATAGGLEGELTFFYANGVPVIKKEGPHQGMVQFIGTQGWVGVNRGDIWSSDDRLLDLKMQPGDVRLYESEHHHRDFIESVKARKDPVASVEVGHRSNTVSLLGEIATILGRPLNWNPAQETFVDDAEADGFLTRHMRAPWIV